MATLTEIWRPAKGTKVFYGVIDREPPGASEVPQLLGLTLGASGWHTLNPALPHRWPNPEATALAFSRNGPVRRQATPRSTAHRSRRTVANRRVDSMRQPRFCSDCGGVYPETSCLQTIPPGPVLFFSAPADPGTEASQRPVFPGHFSGLLPVSSGNSVFSLA